MEPSDEEIMGLMPQQMHEDLAAVVRAMAEQEGISSTPAKGVMRIILNRHVVDLAHAVLARFGDHSPAATKMVSQPAPPAEGEEAVKAVRPSRRQLIMLADDMGMASVSEAAEYARAVLARYGHQPAPPAEGEVADLIAWLGDEADQYDCIQQAPETARRLRRAADLLEQRHPAPPAEGEVAELAERLKLISDGMDALGHEFNSWFVARAADLLAQCQPAPPAEGEVAELVAALRSQAIDCTCDHLTSGDLRRAADLLEQRHPEPVPVSERLPGPGDCDGEGLCWVWHTTAYTWGLFRLDLTAHSHWLPATALPLPAAEVRA